MATQPVPPESEVSAPTELPEPPDLSELDVVLDGSDDLPPGMPPGEPPDDPEGAELTLGEHLNEIRQRLTVAVLTLVLTTVITLIFASTILDYLLEPGRQALPEFRPIYTELLGFIGAYIKISLMLGLAGAMPVIVYQIYAFIHPGLTRAERKWIMPIVGLATVAFACGGAFAFFIGWPPALTFLLNFGQDIADPQVRINNYIDMLTRFVIWTGIIFELPLFLMGLGAIGLVTSRKLLGMWRWAIIGSFLLAALVTPSIDPVTQTFVAVPTMGLFVLGVALVRLVENRTVIPVIESDLDEEDEDDDHDGPAPQPA
ncbi:MAG: twin-arginine translocase subunit TatC [Chloroflexi bacterium]|nr:twin-arginine translocase subunit TatC [Chloroflexota bacterium]